MLIVLTYAWFKSKIFKLGISELLGEEEFWTEKCLSLLDCSINIEMQWYSSFVRSVSQ